MNNLEMEPEWYAIAAMGENRVIGVQNRIPWHLAEDFKFFKTTTMGASLLMGRNTYESIGKPLKGRDTYVLSRSISALTGVQVLKDVEEIRNLSYTKPLFICGGEQVYRQLLPRCAYLYLTIVKHAPDGDSFFPAFEDDFECRKTLHQNSDFEIRLYQNVSKGTANGK